MIAMPRLSALDTKVLRDVRRMSGQLSAIALVIACGLGLYLGMRTVMRSLGTSSVNSSLAPPKLEVVSSRIVSVVDISSSTTVETLRARVLKHTAEVALHK